jgi:Tfp pilus assembly protein PilO
VAELTNNHKNLLRASIIGGVLLSGLFGWLGYQDWKAREAALEQIAQKRAELDRADAQIREIPKLEEKIIVLRETVNEYVRILPEEKEINTFVEKLTEFASRADVRVKKLDDEDVRARSGRNKKGATAAFDRVVYKVTLEGNCEQLLTFMDQFENHERFVRIGSFKIEHRPEVQEGVDPMTIPHQIDLDLETYVYNPKVKSKENVVIPQEGQKLEKLKAAGLLGNESVQDLVLATYKHEGASHRRDLFYDPRIIDDKKKKETEEERLAQRAIVDELLARLQRLAAEVAEEAKIDNTVRRLQAQDRNNRDLVTLGVDIAKTKADHTVTVEDEVARFAREVEQPYEKLAKGRVLEGLTAPILSQQIEEHVVKMRAAMDDSRWEEVVTLHDEVTRLAASVTGIDIRPMMKDADGMQRIAKAHLDFNARPISFGGAVCFENDPAHAVVIINGRSYGPGESVDQDLVVRSISPAQVTFEFRGIVLSQPMKTSAPAPRPATNEKPRAGGANQAGANAQKRKRS